MRSLLLRALFLLLVHCVWFPGLSRAAWPPADGATIDISFINKTAGASTTVRQLDHLPSIQDLTDLKNGAIGTLYLVGVTYHQSWFNGAISTFSTPGTPIYCPGGHGDCLGAMDSSCQEKAWRGGGQGPGMCDSSTAQYAQIYTGDPNSPGPGICTCTCFGGGVATGTCIGGFSIQ